MKYNLNEKIRQIIKNNRRRKLWQRILTGFASAIVFVTVYVLVLPAITMENDEVASPVEKIAVQDVLNQIEREEIEKELEALEQAELSAEQGDDASAGAEDTSETSEKEENIEATSETEQQASTEPVSEVEENVEPTSESEQASTEPTSAVAENTESTSVAEQAESADQPATEPISSEVAEATSATEQVSTEPVSTEVAEEASATEASTEGATEPVSSEVAEATSETDESTEDNTETSENTEVTTAPTSAVAENTQPTSATEQASAEPTSAMAENTEPTSGSEQASTESTSAVAENTEPTTATEFTSTEVAEATGATEQASTEPVSTEVAEATSATEASTESTSMVAENTEATSVAEELSEEDNEELEAQKLAQAEQMVDDRITIKFTELKTEEDCQNVLAKLRTIQEDFVSRREKLLLEKALDIVPSIGGVEVLASRSMLLASGDDNQEESTEEDAEVSNEIEETDVLALALDIVDRKIKLVELKQEKIKVAVAEAAKEEDADQRLEAEAFVAERVALDIDSLETVEELQEKLAELETVRDEWKEQIVVSEDENGETENLEQSDSEQYDVENSDESNENASEEVQEDDEVDSEQQLLILAVDILNEKIDLIEEKIKEKEEELQKNEMMQGLIPLTEEQIAALSPEERAELEEMSRAEAEIIIPLALSNLNSAENRMMYANLSSEKEKRGSSLKSRQNNLIDKSGINIKFPVGIHTDKLRIEATAMLPSDYPLDDRIMIFGYDIKVYVKANNELFQVPETIEYKGITVDIEPAKVEVYSSRVNKNTYDEDKYELYNCVDEDNEINYKLTSLQVKPTDLYTGSGKPYGKAVFKSRDFGMYALYRTDEESDFTIDPLVSGMKVNLFTENNIDHRLDDVDIKVAETATKKEYTKDCKIKVEDPAEGELPYEDANEMLTKVFAYDYYLVKDNAIYELNPEGEPVIKVKVTIKRNGIKVAKKNFYRVYYVEDGELLEEMNITSVKNGSITFETTHFSDYALLESDVDKEELYTVTQDNIDDIPAGEVIDFETFKSMVKWYADNQSGSTIEVELGNIVEISGDKVLSKDSLGIMDNRDLIIKRKPAENGKDDFVHEMFRVKEGASLVVRDITLDGKGIAAYAPIIVNKGTLELEDGAVLQNNRNVGPLVGKTDTTPYRASGGAVWSSGEVVLDGATIQNCEAQNGGGIYIEGSGSSTTFTMRDGYVFSNKAKYYETSWQGGIENAGINIEKYKCAGGGIYLGENVTGTISGGTIDNNRAGRSGGGVSLREIYNSNQGYGDEVKTELTITGGTFTRNRATMCGGALNVSSNTKAIVTGGTFGGEKDEDGNIAYGLNELINDTTYSGGGIYVDSKNDGRDGFLHIENVLIAENTSDSQGGGYAGCPTSTTKIYSFKGALFVKNKAYANLKDIGIVNKPQTKVDIDPEMIGGYELIVDNKPSQYYWYAGSPVTLEQLEELNHSFSVVIRNNKGSRGGGIACNGITTIGEKTESKTMAISVLKEWKGEDDNRPNSIKAELWKDGKFYKEFELSKDNGWYIEFTNLPVAEYEVKEVEVDGYDSQVASSENVTKEVEKFADGFNHLIAWNGKYLKNDSEGAYKYWSVYWGSLAKDAMWRAETGKDGFTLTNQDTKNKLGLEQDSGYWPTGFYGTEVDAESVIFKYTEGVLGSKIKGQWYFANPIKDKEKAKKLLDKHTGYYIPVSSKDSAASIDIYKVIDKAFTITNTKDGVGITLRKIDGEDTSKVLSGAEFDLYELVESGGNDGQDIFEIASVAVNGELVMIKGRKIQELVTKENGEAVCSGLQKGVVYFLKETKAPEGYAGLDPKIIVFKLNDEGTFAKLTEAVYQEEPFIQVKETSVSSDEETIVYSGLYDDGTYMYIKNNKIGYTLPETGGVGREPYYVMGLVVMAGAAMLALIRYKKKGVV